MPPLEIIDQRFLPLVPPAVKLERLSTGCKWSEGPLWLHEDDSILWSDILNNRIMRWSARDGTQVWAEEANFTNGRARDIDGAIIHCSHGLRGITRSRGNHKQDLVLEGFEGSRFNSPNDVVIKSDGTWWFTDPPYGLIMPGEGSTGERELDSCNVFRYDPRGASLSVVSSMAIHPNGLAFSPDESILYVADSSAAVMPNGNNCVFAFDVIQESRLANGRRFTQVDAGVPDGVRCDQRGLLYVSSAKGIEVVAPDGVKVAKIHVPEKVANMTFGGYNRDMLYICATSSLYRIQLRTRGAQLP